MKIRRGFFLMAAAICLLPLAANAQQPCGQFPAPCPHGDEITQAMDFADRGRDNKTLPREMAMESHLRNALTDILEKLARQNHWQVYELNESSDARPNTFIGFKEWESTPYEKRPPHKYRISFIIIVNKDSLQTWRQWYTVDFLQKANQVSENVNAGMQAENNDQLLKTYMDSAQYYSQLSVKYQQDHQTQYLSDLQSNNQKGIKIHDTQVAWFTKKSDEFIKKYQNEANNATASSSNSMDNLKNEKISKTESFINASLVLVYFTVNPALISFGVKDGSQKSFLPQKPLAVPGAFYAGLLHNPQPITGQSYDVSTGDFVYNSPSNVATVFFGAWQHKRDAYQYTHAAYDLNTVNTNLTSIKNIKCDAVQDMAMQIEGRPDYIGQVLKGIDTGALQKIITGSF